MDNELISPHPTGAFAGSVLIHRDVVPLAGAATRTAVLLSDAIGSIGGDIYADQACTMNVYISPDGDNYGDPSVLTVAAGQKVRFEYPELFSRTIKVEVVNGATPMTAFRLFIRGGA